MKIYVKKLPKNCYECEFCGKLKPPAKRPEIECMHCNMMKKLDAVSEFCPLQSIADHDAELLKNAIVPKFKVGQTVWCAGHDAVYYLMIDEIFVSVNNQGYNITYKENGFEAIPEEFIFATHEEAEKALAERGVND